MLPELCKRQSVAHIVQVKSCIAQLGAASYMFSEVKTLLTLFYVIPGSSATGERSFSALRRIKNYLRMTMTSQRLNSVVVMNVHRELTDALDITAVADDFVRGNSARKDIFG